MQGAISKLSGMEFNAIAALKAEVSQVSAVQNSHAQAANPTEIQHRGMFLTRITASKALRAAIWKMLGNRKMGRDKKCPL